VILLASQSDMVIFHPATLGFGLGAFFTRNPTDHNWRQYEMAAISHLPRPILDLGVPNQNPADARPIFRAAFDNLVRWIRGVPPPPARYFQGSIDSSNAFVPEWNESDWGVARAGFETSSSRACSRVSWIFATTRPDRTPVRRS
jgi:hypothetical protein